MFYVRPEHVVQGGPAQGRARDMPPMVDTMLEILLCAGYIWDRITKDNSEAASLDKLLTELEDHIKALNRLLFPDVGSDASAFSWAHAVIWKLSTVPAVNNRKTVADAVAGICHRYPNPLNLLAEFDKACRSHMSDVLAELQGIQVYNSSLSLPRSTNVHLIRKTNCSKSHWIML